MSTSRFHSHTSILNPSQTPNRIHPRLLRIKGYPMIHRFSISSRIRLQFLHRQRPLLRLARRCSISQEGHFQIHLADFFRRCSAKVEPIPCASLSGHRDSICRNSRLWFENPNACRYSWNNKNLVYLVHSFVKDSGCTSMHLTSFGPSAFFLRTPFL